jgi:threonine/homoserine/homoserine lactone efflux protein
MIMNEKFLIFLAAAFVLAISPGPGMLFVLARSLKGGGKVGWRPLLELPWAV